jgi:hypothetical protein
MTIQRHIAIIMICAVTLMSGLVYAFSLSGPAHNLADTAQAASQSPSPSPVPASSTSQLEFLVQGPVVANELFRAATITITPTTRTLTVYATYTNQALLTQTYDNNTNAYDQFWGALQTTGFPNRTGNLGAPGSNCPTGLRYTYTVTGPNSDTLIQTWATSCSTQGQPFTQGVSLANQLIQAQIPGLSQIPDYQPFIQ